MPVNHKVAAIGVFVAVVFQHFQVASLAGYPLTVGLLVGVPLIIFTSGFPRVLGFTLAICLLTAVSGAGAISSNLPDTDSAEFFRTLLLFVLATGIFMTAWNNANTNFFQSRAFSSALFAALALTSTLSILQVAAGAAGSSAFFNVFGQFQYLYQYDPALQFNAIPRAEGFFLEPSYDAFVIGSLAVALLVLRRHVGLTVAAAVVGLLAARSATGLILLLVVAVAFAIRARPVIALLVSFVTLSVVVFTGTYLSSRLSSFGEQGSSANYRLVAPISVLMDTLVHRPFGNALGSVSQVLSGYHLQNGVSAGTSLDNGFYVIVFYFGWVGVFGLVAAFLVTVRAAFASPRSNGFAAVAPIWLFGSLFFSGGIMLPEYAFMIWLGTAIWRTVSSDTKERSFEYPARTVAHDHHGFVRRYPRRLDDAAFDRTT